MSVSISPDGSTLAADMQGSIWTMPSAGGAMKRITDVFNDARQPMWSPDGRTIAFFAYRDGGYDIWAINPDGTNQRKLTWGPYDDREPIFSHDGTRIAFSSDRGNALGSDYNIWTLDLRSGELKQITKNDSEDFMPSWSPDDNEIVFATSRDNYESLWAMNVRSLGDRRVRSVKGARLDAPSWGPGGQIVYHVTAGGQTRYEIEGKPVTGSENVFAFRAAWASNSEYLYVSDGKIRRRTLAGLPMQTVDFTATMNVIHPEYTRRVRDFTSTTPRKTLGIVRPVISPDGTQIAFAAVGDISRDAGERRRSRQHHQGRRARHRSVVVAGWLLARLFVGPRQPAPAAVGPRHEERRQPQGHRHHHAATGRVVLARRQAHRVLQRRRHVARRRDVHPRSRHRPHHADPRLAAAARHADVVARRQAHRARRHQRR